MSLGVAWQSECERVMIIETTVQQFHKARTHAHMHEPGWCRAHASSIDNKTSFSTTLRQLPAPLRAGTTGIVVHFSLGISIVLTFGDAKGQMRTPTAPIAPS